MTKMIFTAFALVLGVSSSVLAHAECSYPMMIQINSPEDQTAEGTLTVLEEVTQNYFDLKIKVMRGFKTGSNGETIYGPRFIQITAYPLFEHPSRPELPLPPGVSRQALKEKLESTFAFVEVSTCYNPELPSVTGSN